MLLEIPDILTPIELARLQTLARVSKFIDGRVTNPHSRVKSNAQLEDSSEAYAESSKMMATALHRNEEFRNSAFPKIMARPMLTKYFSGNGYGLHSDAAFLPIGSRPLRTDLSCTIFIASPESYEGGVLSIALGGRRLEVKGAAGSAVVYPSTTLHEVTAVTAGERIVGLTVIESHIADQAKRELRYELNEVAALEGLSMQWDNYTRLQHVQMGLLRMWSDPG